MRHVNAALGHHLNQITIAEFISDVPADAQNDDRVIEMTTAK